ncbi:hypothetical protein B0H14DRAFT_2653528 [Mycena olivaceomarginata]|nr:hypothetical protein B0H14DRAFT_2653528 [Mycena olivaceomarginata]
MCDAVSASIIFGAPSILPGNRYVSLALNPAVLIIYTIIQQHPSHKLARVERAIEACEDVLQHAKANCARHLLELTDETCRLFEVSASKIRIQLLEPHSVTTREELVEYLRDVAKTMQTVNQCAKKAKEIERSTLLTIENERQHRFLEGIKELHEIHETVISASARRTHSTAARRFESTVTSV